VAGKISQRTKKPKSAPVLPSREDIRAFIKQSSGRVGKREITRHFGLDTELRPALRALLSELAREGEVAPAGHKRFTAPGRLPDQTVVRVTGTNQDGDPIAKPVDWRGDGPPPVIFMAAEARGQPALAPGERVLAKLKSIGGGRYEGRTVKRLSEDAGRILGVYRPPGRLIPTDRRQKAEWRIPKGEEGGAEADEIVLAEPLPATGFGLKPARIVERLGKIGDARAVSLICIAGHGIPNHFPEGTLAEAKKARGVALGKREDLREIPLVTIDGEDARDFDDAVYAESEGSGHRLLVAIADVAHYVRPGSALDRTAYERGNSVYFPDRVVPMLPEALSNGWCSLKPNEVRGCLFVEIRIDAEGNKLAHRFGRGLMRSAARLTYTQVQEIADREEGQGALPPGPPLGPQAPSPATLGQQGFRVDPPALPLQSSGVWGLRPQRGPGAAPLAFLPIRELYAAFRALLSARIRRGTLDLDLPERKVVLNDAGKVVEIAPRPRLDSHRLIEEFMVLANVCAAEELERRHLPCMFRVHAPPSDEKRENLRTFLSTLGISLPPGNQLLPRDLDRVLAKVAGTDQAPLVNEMVLRSQSQAAYDPDNIGHFGLALPKYAHFTSPIRRYADLLVHRALITGCKFGTGALGDDEPARFSDIAEHISATERRAALAEREAIDRYLAAYMADQLGAVFPARISGVTRFGLFVTLIGNGANGLVPMAGLPDDYWHHDEVAQTLHGKRSRVTYRLTDQVRVRLVEATPITGGMIFHINSEAMKASTIPKQGPRRRK